MLLPQMTPAIRKQAIRVLAPLAAEIDKSGIDFTLRFFNRGKIYGSFKVWTLDPLFLKHTYTYDP